MPSSGGWAAPRPPAFLNALVVAAVAYSLTYASLSVAADSPQPLYQKGLTLADAIHPWEVVVVLVDEVSDVEKKLVTEMASTHGGAVALLASDVCPNKTGDMYSQLERSLESLGSDHAHTVVGIGNTAEHVILLSYSNWPVVVAIAPDLSFPPLPGENQTTGESQLLVIADVVDNGEYISGFEDILDGTGISWEIMRIGGVGSKFWRTGITAFLPDFKEPWSRAAKVVHTFITAASGSILETGTEDPGLDTVGVNPKVINYMYGGSAYKAYIAYPTKAIKDEMDVPGVLIIHDKTGMDEYAMSRANMLAQRGYISMVLDSQNVSGSFWDGRDFVGNAKEYVALIRAGIDTLQSQHFVKPASLAVVGYNFGGAAALLEALADSTVKLIVSFHGYHLPSKPDIGTPTEGMIPYLSMQLGAADESETDNISWLQDTLSKKGGNWDITRYGGAQNPFSIWSNPTYDPRADSRSFSALMVRLNNILPTEESILESPLVALLNTDEEPTDNNSMATASSPAVASALVIAMGVIGMQLLLL